MAANISVSAASSLEENAVACKAGKSIARKKKKNKRRAVVAQNKNQRNSGSIATKIVK
jgi:hypothetical protein